MATAAMARVWLLALLALPAIVADPDQSISLMEEQKMEAEIGKEQQQPAEPPSGPTCPIPETSETIPVGGQQQASGKCILYKCQQRGKAAVTVIHSCVVVKPGEGCDVREQDPSLPYPKCCPVTRCSKGRK